MGICLQINLLLVETTELEVYYSVYSL